MDDGTDPLVRMKHIVSAYIAGWHCGGMIVGARSPLNPILGETSQREWPDGTKLYCEQVSHHPPISSLLMIGPNNKWKMYGHMELKVNLIGMTFSAVKLTKVGGFTIEFADGAKYEIDDPLGMVEGLLSD
mmetsp:Transcript_43939/g.59615  ORF Transcript_43939/g.59615 Transcript_43939/m.59615 type:complete len:130 (-) Transcript_43939:487-876(-)